MGMKLFDAADGGADDISKIEIDQEYARRFEHNKKREDLHRLQELQKKGVIEDEDEEDSSSSDESDDSDEIGPSKEDLEFLDALIKVKKQDPSLKEKDVVLFKSDEEDDKDEGGDESKKEKKKKKGKMYLKDVVAKQLIEDGPEFDDDDNGGEATGKKTYNEEQEELKRAFLDAAEEEGSDEEDDGFLSVKKREEGGESGDAVASEFKKKLDEYFEEEKGLDENEMFLKDYFLHQMWIDKDKKRKRPVDEELVDELLNDEEEVEKQEDYETNFRHEELDGDVVMGHSRTAEGSVRQKESKRKRQRQSKEERKMIAEMERKEELKHLKNLKREEINEKLKKFKEIAGIADDEDCLVAGDDLEDEFDPEEYDRMMKKVFDDKYYGAEDVNPEFGSDRDEGEDIEKPDFDKEDELLGLPKGWGVSESAGDGFLAARERVLKQKAEIGEDGSSTGASEDEEDEAGDDGVDGEAVASDEGNRKRKRKVSLVQRAKEALMEEYYKLDYEDTVGDVKTRFKYASTKPNRYGLSTDEIIMIDDKELNQFVSLKRLAPYGEEWKVPNSQRYQFKMKKKELLRAGPSNKHKHGKRKRPRDDAGTSTVVGDDGKAPASASNGDPTNLSRKAKRRRRQAELKLSHQRLLAYGKVSSKSRGKSKK